MRPWPSRRSLLGCRHFRAATKSAAVGTFLRWAWASMSKPGLQVFEPRPVCQDEGQSRQSGFMPHWSARPETKAVRPTGDALHLRCRWHPRHLRYCWHNPSKVRTKTERAERAVLFCAGTLGRKRPAFTEKTAFLMENVYIYKHFPREAAGLLILDIGTVFHQEYAQKRF